MVVPTLEDYLRFFLDVGIPAGPAQQYAHLFERNRIRSEMIPHLSKEILQELGIEVLGDIFAILAYVRDPKNRSGHEDRRTSSQNIPGHAQYRGAQPHITPQYYEPHPRYPPNVVPKTPKSNQHVSTHAQSNSSRHAHPDVKLYKVKKGNSKPDDKRTTPNNNKNNNNNKSVFNRLEEVVFPDGNRIKSRFQSNEKKGPKLFVREKRFSNAQTRKTNQRKSVFSRLETKSVGKSKSSVFERLGP